MKISNDKYYTPISIANHCWEVVWNLIGNKVTEVIEPSCGDGAFFHWHRKPDLGIDILPQIQGDNIIQGDFLDELLFYKQGRLILGNPPFGTHLSLAKQFFLKSAEIADFVAFILPVSQFRNKAMFYEFDLTYSEDLGLQKYTDRELHCCFNVFQRPKNGRLNSKPQCKLKDITIIEHRRNKNESQILNTDKIKDNFDYAMCNWGSGCLGNVPKFTGEYAQEVYFYCHKPQFKNQMIKLLERDTIRNYAQSIASKRISVARLYQYLADNIEGIE